MENVILLKRDPGLEESVRELDRKEALAILETNGCNNPLSSCERSWRQKGITQFMDSP